MDNKNILVCHWGATMSLYKFVEVLKASPKTLLVRVLETETVASAGYGQPVISPKWPLRGKMVMVHGKPTQEERIRLYKDHYHEGGWFSRANGYYSFFEEWDGQPRQEDHND